MSRIEKLSANAVAASVAEMPGWSVVEGKLFREYRFADFVHAFGFMAAAAVAIEALGHHPEWSNVWNRVTIYLTTHDAGGITAKDFELARKLEQLAGKLL